MIFIEDLINSIASTVTSNKTVVAKKFYKQVRNRPETFWQTWTRTETRTNPKSLARLTTLCSLGEVVLHTRADLKN